MIHMRLMRFNAWCQLTISCVLAMGVAACTPAWKKPVPIGEIDFEIRAQSQTKHGVTVTVAVPSRDETTQLFGTSLYNDRIQPVWVDIDNQSDLEYLLLKAGTDSAHFSPLESSFQRHSGSRETRSEMDRFFYSTEFRNPISSNAVTSGFLFTNLDEGFKVVNIDLLNNDQMLNYSFIVRIPGLVTDAQQIDLDRMYEEWVDIETEDELLQILAALPCCATNKKGDKNGDPLNLVFIGHRKDIFSALIRRDWHATEVTYAASSWKTIKSFLFGSRYLYSPISPLYVFGRAQDIGAQKARDSIHLRNHMRIWRTRYLYHDQEIYIGQISRDIGVKFSKRTITTHAIDPDVDHTRDGLLGDLAYSQALKAFGFVSGSQISTLKDTHYNLTPDPYYSDGNRVVLFFSSESVRLTDIESLDWESGWKLDSLDRAD